MFACEICDRQFYYKNSVNRHFRREHINKGSRKRLKCTECDHECRFYQDLRSHFYVEHGIVCKVEQRYFEDFDDFKNWKRKFEETTHYMYVKHSSSKYSSATNERKTYFVCHRTGIFQSGSCGKRKLKRQGSNKINASCPSTMEVVESLSDGSVKLVLWKTHVGHNAEIARTFLSARERSWLAARISEGASYQKIMNEIHKMDNKGGRMCFIKSQDIRNLRKNLINSRNHNILTGIRTWVKNVRVLENSSDFPIIYFKDRNVSDPGKILCNKDVMLIVMTEFQEKTLKDFGSGMICVDATHCQENYEYQLITVYASNERIWCPMIYCITNSVNLQTISYFLTKVKEKIGHIRCSVFLSDDNPPFFEAWCDVMNEPEFHFIHLWYLERNWKENVLKLKCSDAMKTTIFNELRHLLIQTDEKSFLRQLNNFFENLRFDSRITDFCTYFQNEFVKRASTWASCYWQKVSFNFNSQFELEKLHKRLYDEYHRGVNSQKMSDCINILLTTAHACDQISKTISNMCCNLCPVRDKSIQNGHRLGVCVKRSEVNQISNSLYKINKNKTKNETYDIRWLNLTCKCQLRCSVCKICAHEFSCTCADYVVNFNICKHIHACAIIKNDIKVDLSAETDAPLDSFVEEVICEEEIICNMENKNDDSDEEEEEDDDDDDDDYDDDDDDDDEIRFLEDSDIATENECVADSGDRPDSVTRSETPSKLEDERELDFGHNTSLFYEPFAFVDMSEIEQRSHAALELPDGGLQIVAFHDDDEYEAVLVNDDDSSSFGDTSSIYEDIIPPKGAIIALGFGAESSDSYIFRRFDDNTIISHKVDALFALGDFDGVDDNDIAIQLNSQLEAVGAQDFQTYYDYERADDDSIILT